MERSGVSVRVRVRVLSSKSKSFVESRVLSVGVSVLSSFHDFRCLISQVSHS